MIKKVITFLLIFILSGCVNAFALEIVRQKNIATKIVFPMIDADGDTITGAAGLDSEETHWDNGTNPSSFADLTNEATEIGTTGIYYLSLTAGEVNQDYVALQVKTSTSGGKTQHILIRTMAGDHRAVATTTTAGNTIDVASTGEVGLDFSNIKDAGSTHTLTNITVPTVTDVTNAVGVKTGTGANQLDVTSGRIKADTVYWNGSAVATPDTTGYPKVTIKNGTGTGEVSLSSGTVTVGTNNDKTGYTASTVSDKTGYSLTQAFPTNFSSLSIDGSGRIDIGKWIGTAPNALISGRVDANAQVVGDKTGYSLTQTFPTNFSSLSIDSSGRITPTPVESMMVHSGTAQAGAAGSITLASGASSTDDLYKGMLVKIYGATGAGQARTITAYNGTTKVATVAWNWITNPDSTSTYALIVSGNPSINSSLQVSTTASDPWSTALPGSYGAGTAGKIIGDNLNATVSSRLASSAVPTNFSSMAITAGGAVTIGTNNDKTGYSLTQAFPSNFSSMAIDGSGRVDLGKWIGTAPNVLISGRVDSNAQVVGDKTGYSLTQSFPTNFSSLAITGGGAVTVGTNNDKTGYALTAGEEDAIVDKVWDEAVSGHVTTGTTGKKLNDIPLTGSGDWTTTEKENIRDALGVTGTKTTASGGQLQVVKTTTDKFLFDVSNFVKSTPQTSVIVGTNNDKTGYSLTQTFPGNFSLLSIDSNGRVDMGKWVGVAPNWLISGRVDANAQVVGDKSGYSLTQSFPANFSAFTITAGGAVTVGTNNDKTSYALTSAEEDAIVDKVWDELRSGHATSGTFGQGVASVQGNVTGSVNSVTSGVTVSTNNDKTGYRLSATGVDDVWDESQSGHTSAGTFGKYLDAQVSSVTAPSAATVASAVWEETSNHTTVSTMGKKLNDASLAGNPWAAASICDGLNAGQCLSSIKDSTDGDKEGIDYTGIEKTIRAQR